MRRGIGTVAAVGLLTVSLGVGGCGASQKVGALVSPTERTTTASLPRFERVQTKQDSPVWCWAACAEMIHAYRGRRGPRYEQSAIAERVTGVGDPRSPEARAASELGIMQALAPNEEVSFERVGELISKAVTGEIRLDDRDVQEVISSSPVIIADALSDGKMDRIVIDALSKREPAALLLKPTTPEGIGHVVVITGVTWRERERYMPIGTNPVTIEIESIDVVDPQREEFIAPNSGDRVLTTLTGEEFRQRAARVLTPEISQRFLRQLDQAFGK